MKCKYCGKEIAETDVFCSGCGQSVGDYKTDSSSEEFWSIIEKNHKNDNKKYNEAIQEEKKAKNKTNAKRFTIFLSVAFAVVLVIIATTAISNISETNLEQVKENLKGLELTSYHSESNGPPLFGSSYYYQTLKFNDDGTLDLYYMESGKFYYPGDDDYDEYVPEFVDTYNYTVTKKFLGSYVVEISNTTFTLSVDGCQPDGIHYESGIYDFED